MTRPIVAILLSDKRTGSTMVQSEICKHPDINHVEYSPHTFFETHHWLKGACVLDLPRHLFSGHRRYRGYGSRASARRYLIDCVRGNVPEFIVPADDEALVFQGWEVLCRRYAQPVFFEKSPQHIHHQGALDLLMTWVEMTQFDARVVGLVRNPLAVMYSAEKAFSTDPSRRQYGWAEAYRNLLFVRDFLGPERFRLLRYEDVVDDPARELGEICRFLGTELDDSVGASVHSESRRTWAHDSSFTLKLHGSVRRVAEQLGYEPAELENPHAGASEGDRTFNFRFQNRLRLVGARFFQRILKPLALRTWQRK